ncbi:MAG: hypothetical protein WCX65_12060 [bacterium]
MVTQRTRLLILYLFILIGIVLLFSMAWMTSQVHNQLAIGVILGLGIGMLSFVRQDIAAVAILLSMVLSPELKLASLPTREVVVRFDDLILISFFISWLFKMAYLKNFGLLKVTALNMPIWTYILVAIISTWLGVGAGNLQFLSAMFYILKYIEYFMIFFMFSNIIQTEAQLKTFLTAFMAGAGAVGLYGYYQIAIGVSRISAPFEGYGEPNTYGGYLLLVLGLAVLSFFKSPDKNGKLAYAAVVAGAVPLLVMTFSRASYFGFVIMIPAFYYFANRNQRVLIVVVALVGLAASPFILPEKAKDRIMAPFSGQKEEVAPMLRLNRMDSSYQKVQTAKYIVELWSKEPFFGRGVTGVGLVDAQYPRILGEMGIMGVLAFMWIGFSIFQVYRTTSRYLRDFTDDQEWRWKAVTQGYICAIAGLLIHGLAANTFVLIRIMEPFWFLTAVVASIPHILENKYHPAGKAGAELPKYPIYHTGHESY